MISESILAENIHSGVILWLENLILESNNICDIRNISNISDICNIFVVFLVCGVHLRSIWLHSGDHLGSFSDHFGSHFGTRWPQGGQGQIGP